jgi:hypothetical protein
MVRRPRRIRDVRVSRDMSNKISVSVSLSANGAQLGRQSDRMMMYAIAIAGIAAAISLGPIYWFTTAGMLLFVKRAQWRALEGPSELPTVPIDAPLGMLPPRVNEAVRHAVAQLPTGDARLLLGGVIRQARPLFGNATSAFDPSKDDESRAHAAELVIASCDTALELARLDALLAAESRADKKAASEQELVSRYAAVRARFVKRLTDAAAALGELYASGIENGTPASDRVQELVGELKSDAASRAAAKVEVDELLK